MKIRFKNNKKGRALAAKQKEKEARKKAAKDRINAKKKAAEESSRYRYIKYHYTGRYDLTDEYDTERREEQFREKVFTFWKIVGILLLLYLVFRHRIRFF